MIRKNEYENKIPKWEIFLNNSNIFKIYKAGKW